MNPAGYLAVGLLAAWAVTWSTGLGLRVEGGVIEPTASPSLELPTPQEVTSP